MPHSVRRGVNLGQELRWAWRGVRARGWRAVFVVSLFAVALAANAIVFSAADAFVFRTLPYHDPGKLVVLERVDRSVSDWIWPQTLREWHRHRDVFAGVYAHVWGSAAYVTTGGVTEIVRSETIAPGLLEMLGVLPAWGRPLTPSDTAKGAPPVAIIGEAFARRQFGDPESALNRTFATGSQTLTVVGVMPASFRFPTAREEIWQPLDLDAWPNNSGVRNVARLAAGVTLETAIAAVVSRRDSVNAVVDGRVRGRNDEIRLRSMADVRGNANASALFAMLVGAAACLLLIACANVASLELAAAARRVRSYAVQSALGASRSSLIRVGLLEGAELLGASAALGIALTYWGASVMDAQLTTTMRAALTNPLDVDLRVIGFMLAVAGATWLLTAMPSIVRISRLSVVEGLRDDPRTMPVSRGAARGRQLLVAGQVALTSLLLVGGLLYLRSYLAQTGRPKGFDATNVATVEVFRARDAPQNEAELESTILERLGATPWIQSVSRTGIVPPSTQSGIMAPLSIEGRATTRERVMIHTRHVDPEYFRTMGIDVIQGRAFDASTPPEHVLVDERFARRYWPDGSVLGARFKLGSATSGGVSTFHVVGVTRQLRSDRLVNEEGDEVYVAHMRISPTYHPLTFVAKLDNTRRLGDLAAIVRSIAERSVVRVDTVEARYARLHADTRLAAAVTTGFGVVALLVATAGIYAVMAFVVAGRSKEIAIRMALGAGRAGVRALILRSSLTAVASGVAIGLVAAALLSQAVSAQFAAVSPTDPPSYIAVSALLIATAVAATWWPARRASRVDPAVTLRAE